MINGEYGNILRIETGEDISNNTNKIELRSPSPHVTTSIITTVEGLTIGTTDRTIDNIDYVTDQYVEYTFKEGDVNAAGLWGVCLISLTPGGENKILGPLNFSVDDC